MGNQKLFGDQGDLAWEDCQVRQKIAVNVDGCHSGTESLLSLDSWLSLMQLCRRGVVVAFFLSLVWTSAVAADSAPPDFADLSERLLPAVVNIATTQDAQSGPGQPVPQFPPGSPFEEFFKEFLTGGKGDATKNWNRRMTVLLNAKRMIERGDYTP